MLRARDGVGTNVSSNRNDRSLWMFFSNGVRRCQTIYRLGLTMLDLSYMILDMINEKTEERRNRFTGQREFLTKEEADIHDSVFVHEALEQWPEMQKALDKFSRLNPKAYMTLLD